MIGDVQPVCGARKRKYRLPKGNVRAPRWGTQPVEACEEFVRGAITYLVFRHTRQQQVIGLQVCAGRIGAVHVDMIISSTRVVLAEIQESAITELGELPVAPLPGAAVVA